MDVVGWMMRWKEERHSCGGPSPPLDQAQQSTERFQPWHAWQESWQGGQMSPGLGSQLSQQELHGQGWRMDTWAWPVTVHTVTLLDCAVLCSPTGKFPQRISLGPPSSHKFTEQLLGAKQRHSMLLWFIRLQETHTYYNR